MSTPEREREREREREGAPSFTETGRGHKEYLPSFLLILEPPLSSLWPREKRINQSNIGTNTKVITQLENWSQMRRLREILRDVITEL